MFDTILKKFNQVVLKLQFQNNFLIKKTKYRALDRYFARLVRQPTGLSNKFNPLFPAVFFLGLLAAPLFGQTAVELEDLLQTQAVSYGQAARFVLEAADAANSQNILKDPQRACAFAAEQRWLPAKADAADTARLDGVSLLLMRSFDVKGGMWYSLTKSPRYAYRELVYQDVIQGKADPAMTVSGEHLLFLINRLLSLQEDPSAESGEEEQQTVHVRQLSLVERINTRLEALAITDTRARVTNEGVAISLSNIQFLANSTELPESEKRKLREIARILEDIPAQRILVGGHTAQAGTPQDQFRTSLQRADVVAAYLVVLGVSRSKEIYAQGYGTQRPIADNTPVGMALNRRVEITILDQR